MTAVYSRVVADGKYASRAATWLASHAYLAGEIVEHSGTLYKVNANFTSPGSFTTTGLTSVGGGAGGSTISASSYTDLNDLLLDAGTSVTNWSGHKSPTVQAPVLNTAYDPDVVSQPEFFFQLSHIYMTLPAAVAVGTYSHVKFDVNFANVAGDTPTEYLQAIAASGTVGTGTRSVRTDMLRQVPNTLGHTNDDDWHTVYVPLAGITSLRSIGLEARNLSPSVGTGRAILNIRNVYLAEATGLDQAIAAASPIGSVVIPAGYTSAKTQRSWVDRPAGVKIDDQRAGREHRTGIGGFIWADDYLLDIAGNVDVGQDLAWIVNEIASPGDTVQLHPGAHYLANKVYRGDSFIRLDAESVTIRGNNATVFQGQAGADKSIIMAPCTDMEFTDLHVIGDYNDVFLGSALYGIAGTPTDNGTAIELNALNEAAQITQLGDGRPIVYGRDRNNLCKIVVSAKDTAQVASDFIIEVIDPITGLTDASSTVTLTASYVDYALEWEPPDIEAAVFVNVRKLTATANTISVASITAHRTQGYSNTRPFNAAFNFGNSKNIRVYRCRGESIGGDAMQVSAFCSGLDVDGFVSRCAGRQGVSFNWGERFRLRNFNVIGTGRSGIDVEPYAAGWYVRDLELDNWRFSWVQNWPLLCENWGACYDVRITNIYIKENGRTPISFGARGMIIDNVIASAPYTHPDGVLVGGFTGNELALIFGTNVQVGKIETGSGWTVVAAGTAGNDEDLNPVTTTDVSVTPRHKAIDIAYAATITPHHTRTHASDIYVGALTGNITVANPPAENAFFSNAVMWRGYTVTFHFVQDATGSRTVTWGSKYHATSTISATPSSRSSFRFVFDGTDYWEI